MSQVSDRDTAILRFELINNDNDSNSKVNVLPLSNEVDLEGVVNPTIPNSSETTLVGPVLDLSALTAQSTIVCHFENVRYDATTQTYRADLSLENTGVAVGRKVAVLFDNLPIGVTLLNPSGTNGSGKPYVSFSNAIGSGGLPTNGQSDSIALSFNLTADKAFGLNPKVLASVNHAPILDPITSLSTIPGAVLRIPLHATDSDGDPIHYSMISVSSPGATGNASHMPQGALEADGTIVFRPTMADIGVFKFDVVASDGARETKQSVTLTVKADSVATTRVSGKVLRVNGQPIAGMQISIGTVTGLTKSDGSFSLDLGTGTVASDTIKVRGDLYSGPITYPFIAEKINLLLKHDLLKKVNNVIDRPIYLIALDTANGKTVNPTKDTTVTTAAIPNSSVFVKAGTLLNQQGTLFTGKLSITEVPVDRTPAALPGDLHPDLVVTIQPGEMVFSVPAPLSLPNKGGYAAGTKMILWSINPVTGQFDNVGTGQVSTDGKVIQTISGGIRNSSWHLFIPPIVGTATDVTNDPFNELNNCDSCKARLSQAIEMHDVGSDVEEHSGAVVEDYNLASYQSLGVARGVSLHYDSVRADPRQIIHLGYNQVDADASLYLVASLNVKAQGVDIHAPGISNKQFGLSIGDNVWKVPNFPPNPSLQNRTTGDLAASLQVDMRNVPSGVYDYNLTRSLRRFDGTLFSGTDFNQNGKIIQVNSVKSVFGSGWGLAGLEQLIVNSDGSVLLVDGDGTEMEFTKPANAGQPYLSPPGDFSLLERLPNGTFRRTLKDKTVYTFNSDNQLAMVRDRNGNTIQYKYNTGLLNSIIDPVGLTTTFSYVGNRLSAITDPAGRTTLFSIDANNNLVGIIAPDTSQQRWQYDSGHHLIVASDPRGFRSVHNYDSFGRATSVVRADGSSVRVVPVQTQNLLQPSKTSNPLNPPVAFFASPPFAFSRDGVGNIQISQLDQRGQLVTGVDGSGLEPNVVRNSQNQVIHESNALGQATSLTYDDRGNVTSVRDLVKVSRIGNDSTGRLFAEQQYFVNGIPQLEATGDFNEDGHLDLVTGNSTATFSFFLGDGNGSFTRQLDLNSSKAASAIAVADLDGDGHLDIVSANPVDYYDGTVAYLPGNGKGNFGTPVVIHNDSYVGIAIGDLNGDHIPDVVLTGSTNIPVGVPLTVLIGTGRGKFAAPIDLAGEVSAGKAAIADMNGDGKADIVVIGSPTANNSLMILAGDGKGKFAPPKYYSGFDFAVDLKVVDVNRDGYPDIVTANTPSTVTVMLGKTNGEFEPVRSFSVSKDLGNESQVKALTIADFNGDGFLDVATANYTSLKSVSLLLGDGKGNFVAKGDFSSFLYGAVNVVSDDVNEDGISDILVAEYKAISVLLGDGRGSFDVPHSHPIGPAADKIALGDLDGDGRLDLVATNVHNSLINISKGDGAGGFTLLGSVAATGEPQQVILSDMNRDGILDIVSSNALSNSVSIFSGNGDGTFATEIKYDVGELPIDVTAADIDGDGLKDLVTANFTSNSASVLLGTSSGNFAPQIQFTVGNQPVSIAVADLNRDEKLDIVTLNQASKDVSILLGNGNSGFASPVNFAINFVYDQAPGMMRLGDTNSDGIVDIVVSCKESLGGSGTFAVLFGDGLGKFNTPSYFYVSFGAVSAFSLTDTNNDNKLDLVVAQNGNSGFDNILFGNGKGEFPTGSSLQFRNYKSSSSVGVGDVNNDGQVDLVFCAIGYDNVSRAISTFISDGKGAYTEVSSSIVGNYPRLIVTGDFDLDGNVDVLTGNSESNDLSILLGDGKGDLRLSTIIPLDGRPTRIESVIDLNADGILDLIIVVSVVSGTTLIDQDWVLMGDGKGGFRVTQKLAYFGELPPLGDVNQDGIPDIVFASDVMKVSVKLGDGTGKFSTTIDSAVANDVQNPPFLSSTSVGGLADLDDDGNLDLVVTISEPFSGPQFVWVLPGNGRGGFKQARSTISAAAIQLVDTDNDGRVDIIASESQNRAQLLLLRSFGSDKLASSPLFAFADSFNQFSFVDVDGDQHVDLVSQNFGGEQFSFRLNDGLGHLGSPVYYANGYSPLAIAFADLNKDHRPDFIVADHNNSVLISLGGGDLTANLVSTTSYDPTFNEPTSITDERGNKTTFDIDPTNGNVRSITQPGGTRSRFTYNSRGQVATIIDPLGRERAYVYDALGRLVTLTIAKGTSSQGVRHFEYDTAGNQTAMVDENNHRTEYQNDKLNRLSSTKDALGNLTKITYDKAGNLTSTQDALGNVTTNTFDTQNRLSTSADALGQVSRFEYDREGNLTKTTDPLGRSAQNIFDSRDRLMETIDPAGGRTVFRYDANDNLIATTDPLGHVTSYYYDARKRLIQEVNPLGGITKYDYDEADNLIAKSDPNGNRTQYEYDTLNRMKSQTDALGGVTRFSYDAVGNLISQSDQLNHTSHSTYDARDRLIKQTDALGDIATFSYDSVGNLVNSIDPLGRKATNSYDALNRRTSTTDPLGNISKTTYDAVGNVLTTTDPKGNVTKFAYDKLNRVVSQTNALNGIRSNSYDAVGNLIASTDELGRSAHTAYDRLDRPISVTDALGNTSRMTYDADSNLRSSIDPLGHTTSYTYDALNRKTQITDSLGGVTSSTFDPNSNLLSLTDPEGNKTQYAYDELNRVTSETNALGKSRTFAYDAASNLVSKIDRNGRRSQFQYDSLNRSVGEKWLDATNKVIYASALSFDAAGQLKSTSDPSSKYAYSYDADGRLASSTNAGTPGVLTVAFAYSYDANNNLLSRQDKINGQNRGVNNYQYDALNRETRVTQAGAGVANKRVDFGYDADGEMVGINRYADLTATQFVASSTFSYDRAARLSSLTHAKGASKIAQYAYTFDATSRISKIVSNDGTANYGYDATDQLTSATSSTQTPEKYSYDANGNRTNTGYRTGTNNQLLSDGTFNYTYDAEGNRVSQTQIATGIVTRFEWDHHNRLTHIFTKSAAGTVTSDIHYSYDVNDRRIAKSVDSDGAGPKPVSIERFVYDGQHIAVSFDGTGKQTHRYLHGPTVDQILADETALGQVLWPLTDHQGTVRDIVNSSGVVQDHLVYNSFGTITSETNPAIPHLFTYTGRELDTESGLYFYRARYYDPMRGRFLAEDPVAFAAGDLNLVLYVGNSPLSKTDPFGLKEQPFRVYVEGPRASGGMAGHLQITMLDSEGRGSSFSYGTTAALPTGFFSGLWGLGRALIGQTPGGLYAASPGGGGIYRNMYRVLTENEFNSLRKTLLALEEEAHKRPGVYNAKNLCRQFTLGIWQQLEEKGIGKTVPPEEFIPYTSPELDIAPPGRADAWYTVLRDAIYLDSPNPYPVHQALKEWGDTYLPKNLPTFRPPNTP